MARFRTVSDTRRVLRPAGGRDPGVVEAALQTVGKPFTGSSVTRLDGAVTRRMPTVALLPRSASSAEWYGRDASQVELTPTASNVAGFAGVIGVDFHASGSAVTSTEPPSSCSSTTSMCA